MTVSVKPRIRTVASLFLIEPVYVLPFTVTVTLPVASFKPVTITLASSPTVIGWADALIVKFSFGLGLTVILTVVDAGLYFSSPLKLTLASSPTVIGFAVASIVKFSLGGIGFSWTATIIFLLSAAA